MDVHDLVIIGSGPAGYTAAIYAARAELKPVLFEGLMAGGQPGGQLMLTTDIENFPGFPEGISGAELMENCKKQAARFGTTILPKDVTAVDLSSRPFVVRSDSGEVGARCLIIATGAVAQWLDLESVNALRGYGVSACATCDGPFFRSKEVLVVGGGDTALEEALFLAKFASSVTIVHRRDELRASKIMQDRVRKHPKISFIWNSVIREIQDVAAKKVTGVVLENVKDHTTSTRKCEGVFMAIGHKPNTDLFKGQLELDEKGYLKADCSARTNVPGVFAAGDVRDPEYRQAISAAATGCIAAIEAERYLASAE
ncbi:MAG: thioredoxin-disulfide reductase [Candidatus Omnitrophica bacterium]|nr:thioredoxin-disulfide reductase [Candidatus Omnitrophota bacterium]